MAQVKEKLITNMARYLYEKLLGDTSLAVPHDNGIQNRIWSDPYLQQKVIIPLKHHVTEDEIIRKFNEVFNQVAEDVRKRHGENIYSLQNTSSDEFFNTSAGLCEVPAYEKTAVTVAMVADSVKYSSDKLTPKEEKYLKEMALVFNDDASAVSKTYSHFSRFGVSRELQHLYECFCCDGVQREEENCEEMEEKPEISTKAIPSWALGYLINGDGDALDDDEYQMVLDFEDEYEVYPPDDDAEEYFTNAPAFGLPCMAIDCEVRKKKEKREPKPEDNEELFSAPPSYGYY